MPDTLRLAGALLAPHSHQEGDLLDGDLYARLAASETVTGLWGFPAAGIKIGQEALSSPAEGLLAVEGDLEIGGSISLDGTVDGVDVSDHAALHERGGSQVVRAARLHSGTDAGKPSSGNTEGDVWWATDSDKLYVWNGAAWKEIGAAGGGSVAVEEADVQVVAAASVLDFGAGFNVTENPSGEANIALDLTEAVWTFAQGGFYFRDSSGPLLATGASGDDLNLTGDLDVSGHMAIGSLATIQAYDTIRLRDVVQNDNIVIPTRGILTSITDSGGSVADLVGVYCFAENTGASNRRAMGLFGQGKTSATVDGSWAAGLSFAATANAGAHSVEDVTAIEVTLQSLAAQTGEVTLACGIRIIGAWVGGKPLTAKGIYIPSSFAPSGVGTAYGIHIENLAGSTAVRLLELGPETPYLRLIGGGAPGANQTNLYLNENGTLRRVQWKAGNTLGAGDKVLVLV